MFTSRYYIGYEFKLISPVPVPVPSSEPYEHTRIRTLYIKVVVKHANTLAHEAHLGIEPKGYLQKKPKTFFCVRSMCALARSLSLTLRLSLYRNPIFNLIPVSISFALSVCRPYCMYAKWRQIVGNTRCCPLADCSLYMRTLSFFISFFLCHSFTMPNMSCMGLCSISLSHSLFPTACKWEMEWLACLLFLYTTHHIAYPYLYMK